MKTDTAAIRPMVAGPRGFYPRNPEELRSTLDNLLRSAQAAVGEAEPVALVVPHAGYTFSGAMAARAYAQLRGHSYDRVVVIGPSHYELFPGASVFRGSGYQTPLGNVPVDGDFVRALHDTGAGFGYTPQAEEQEHSVEVQVPFLQRVLGAFDIVPVLIHDGRPANCRALADGLVSAMHARPRRTLLVASSDLYHGPGHKRARAASDATAGVLAQGDPERFAEAVATGACQACGSAAIVVALMAARALGAERVRLLGVTTSFEVAPRGEDYVVGYLAAVIHR